MKRARSNAPSVYSPDFHTRCITDQLTTLRDHRDGVVVIRVENAQSMLIDMVRDDLRQELMAHHDQLFAAGDGGCTADEAAGDGQCAPRQTATDGGNVIPPDPRDDRDGDSRGRSGVPLNQALWNAVTRLLGAAGEEGGAPGAEAVDSDSHSGLTPNAGVAEAGVRDYDWDDIGLPTRVSYDPFVDPGDEPGGALRLDMGFGSFLDDESVRQLRDPRVLERTVDTLVSLLQHQGVVPTDVVYDYAQDKGLLMMSQETRSRYGIPTSHVHLRDLEQCATNSVVSVLLEHVVGWDTAVLNAVLVTSGGVGYVYARHTGDMSVLAHATEVYGLSDKVCDMRTRVMAPVRLPPTPLCVRCVALQSNTALTFTCVRCVRVICCPCLVESDGRLSLVQAWQPVDRMLHAVRVLGAGSARAPADSAAHAALHECVAERTCVMLGMRHAARPSVTRPHDTVPTHSSWAAPHVPRAIPVASRARHPYCRLAFVCGCSGAVAARAEPAVARPPRVHTSD